MFINKTQTFPLALVIITLLTLTNTAYAQSASPSVVIRPETILVGEGQTTGVTVMVQDVQDLYGIDLSLTFDPQMVAVVDADPNAEGVQVGFGTFLSPGFELINKVDQTAGTIRFAMTQVNPSEPKFGNGVLLVVTLRGLQAGTSATLALADAQLGQRGGVMLDPVVETEPVDVRIVETDKEVPEVEPVPTQETTIDFTATPMPTATTATSPPPTSPNMTLVFAISGGIILA
ncbi:MAG: cohesin domain-containing protein, partial [Anaerolineales bacterium]